MSEDSKNIDKLISDLKERAKELNCLYEFQELVSTPGITVEEVCERLVDILPPFWQYPDICQAKVTYGGSVYQPSDFTK